MDKVVIFGHFTVYFYFKTRNHFRDEIIRLVINTRLITTLKNVDMFKIIEYFLIYVFHILWLKALQKFHYVFFGFVRGAQFSKWQQIQSIAKCKY